MLQSYYNRCRGAWSCVVALEITDAAALSASGMGWLDRWSLHALARWPAWLGPVRMRTTVEVRGPAEVLHTTTVSWRGLPLRRSVERITLSADGRSLDMVPLTAGGLSGQGEVAPDGDGVRYELRWLGVDVVQETRLDGDTVTLDQVGPGFRARQRLVRTG